MAITLSSTDLTCFGSRENKKQQILYLPAEATANKPAIIVFGNVDGSGNLGDGIALWADNTGSLRYHTSLPTDEDSDGTAIGSGTGASKALDDLASVAINTSLISDTKNTDDLGSAAIYWKDLYVGGDIHIQEAGAGSKDVTLSFTAPTDDYTYTFPNAGAAATVMLDTGAANVITHTKGTSTINLAAAADITLAAGAQLDIGAAGNFDVGTGAVAFNGTAAFDQATGTTVDINANLTVSGAAVIDQDLSATGSPTWTSDVNIGADSTKVTWGASGSTDSYIQFNGAGDMMLYDSNLGVARSLTELYSGTTLNPSVSGDLSVPDGKFTWTDATAEAAGVWTFAGTSTTDISITSSITTGKVLSITADDTANGTLAYLDADGGVGATGYYLYAYNGTNPMFTVGENGATAIAGSAAGTDALTLTAGDLALSSGYLDLEAPVGNGGHNIATADDGTSATPFITITNSDTGFDQAMILLDSNATGAYDAMQITHDSTGYGLSVVGTAATGKQLLLQGPASQTTAMAVLDGATGSWIGAADVGMLDISSDGALVAGANLLRVDSSGTNAATTYVAELISSGALAAAVDGAVLKISETGAAQATSYAVNIASTNNEALHVDSGLSLFDERVTITLANNTGPALAITNPDTTGDTHAVTIVPSGAGAGIAITPQEADTQGLLITTIASSTVPLVDLDLTTGAGWIGAASTGAIDLVADGTLANASASLIRLSKTGETAASMLGSSLSITDASTGGSTAGYAVYLNVSGALEALKVDAGECVFDEKITCSGGVVTQVDVTDIANGATPTNLEAIAAFGAAATTGAGFIGIVDDAGGHAAEALVWSDGTKYWYISGTACA